MVMITEETTIGSIVSDNYRTAQVLSKYNIDFCCGGGRNLQSACLENDVDVIQLIKELKAVNNSEDGTNIDFQSWSADLLVDYIEKKFHRITREQMPEISKFMAKLCRVHGNNHPELFEVEEEFNNAVAAISTHMENEERKLFPIIKKYYQNQELSEKETHIIETEINSLQSDHDVEGDRFKKISQLTDNYTVPDDGCKTYEIGMKSLHDFEKTLHKHVHVENNILFNKLHEIIA